MIHRSPTTLVLALALAAGCATESTGETTPDPAAGGDTGSESQPASDPSTEPAPVTAADLVNDEDAPSHGPADASVVVELYSDFECPYCARARATVAQIREAYPDVRIVYRFFPLDMHQHARTAAMAALEAYHQGGDEAFWRYHDLLFDNQEDLSERRLLRFARRAGLNDDRLRQALEDRRHEPRIEVDRERALRDGVQGTPTYIVNGDLALGPDFESVEELILEFR